MVNLDSPIMLQNIMLVSNFFVPLVGTIISMPFFIKKFTQSGIIVRDYYKKDLTMVPTRGGIAILLIAMLSFSLNTLFFKFADTNYVALIVIALFGIFGILDDMIDIGRTSKLLIMYYCSYPLIQYATHTAVTLPSIGSF